LLDTNVFVAAIRNPRKQTKTLRLIMKIIEDPNISIVGSSVLVEEMLRYGELLKSETAAAILSALLDKMRLVQVSPNFRTICKKYVRTPNKADILHAATCLQTQSILITNDRHFDKIRDAGIINVWSVAEALKNLL